jgi:hypothetical protein
MSFETGWVGLGKATSTFIAEEKHFNFIEERV